MNVKPLKHLRIWISHAFIVLIPITIFVLILKIGIPLSIIKLINNRYLMLLISFLLFLLCSTFKKAGSITTLLTIFILFSLPLSYYWTSGITTQKILCGLIPHRDSMYSYLNARNALNGKLFGMMTVGRPMFPSFLAFLVAIAQDNIQTMLIIMVTLCAFSHFFLCREIQIKFGRLPMAIYMAVLYVFYSRWIPHLASEQMGILLATLGLALILCGMRLVNKKIILLGILIITLALIARIGAMFVLPSLAIFMGLAYTKKRFSFKDFGWAVIAVLVGFLINTLIYNLLSDPAVMPFASFVNALYGQSKGGAGWTIIQKDFPGLSDPYEILELALINIKNYPLGMIISIVKSYRDFLLPGKDNAFVFITSHGNSISVYLAWIFTWFFSIYELINSYRNRNEPFNLFKILIFLGILLSVPFAPPRDSGSMRTYAATVPMLLLLPVAGFARFLEKVVALRNKKNLPQKMNSLTIVIYSLVIVGVIVFPPIFIRIFSQPVNFQVNQCTSEQIPISFKLDYGSYITIVPDGTEPCGNTPNICLSKFINDGSYGFQELYNAIVKSINDTKTPVIFTVVNDLNTGRYYHLLIDKNDLPDFSKSPPIYSACLQLIDQKEFLYSARTLIKERLSSK